MLHWIRSTIRWRKGAHISLSDSIVVHCTSLDWSTGRNIVILFVIDCSLHFMSAVWLQESTVFFWAEPFTIRLVHFLWVATQWPRIGSFPSLRPILGSRFGTKSGSAMGEFCCCPQRFCKQICDALAWAIHAFSLSASHFVPCTVEAPFWPPCFYWFFGSCFGSYDEAGCWHSRRSKAYRDLPEARMAGATVEETAFEDVNMWQAPPPS